MVSILYKVRARYQPNGAAMLSFELQLSVIIPAYNEESRLNRTLGSMWRALRRRFTDFEIIVVDDGSTDRTAAVVRDFSTDHPEVRLISYPENRGKGFAVRRGILASRGRHVLFSDADQSTPMREVRKLMKALDEVHIAIGSRAIGSSRIVEYQPFYRVLMGKTFNKLVQLLAVPGVSDTQCGFKCFRGNEARQLFAHCRIDGFSFDVEALFVARKMGLSIREVGVLWRNDRQSHVHPVIHSLQMLRDLLLIRYYHQRSNYIGSPAVSVGTDR